MRLDGLSKHGSTGVERGTIVICILNIFSIYVQDVPYYNHAAGSQASMIVGKTLALISLRGVVSSQRSHGVVIDTTLLATGSSYGKIPALTSRGVIISSRMNGVLLQASPSSSEFARNDQLCLDYLLSKSSNARATTSSTWIICSANHRNQEQRPVLPGLSAQRIIGSQHDQFYLDYLYPGQSLIISIGSKSKDQFYLGRLLSESSEAKATTSSIGITCSAYHRKQEQQPVIPGLPAERIIGSKSYSQFFADVETDVQCLCGC